MVSDPCVDTSTRAKACQQELDTQICWLRHRQWLHRPHERVTDQMFAKNVLISKTNIEDNEAVCTTFCENSVLCNFTTLQKKWDSVVDHNLRPAKLPPAHATQDLYVKFSDINRFEDAKYLPYKHSSEFQ